jgi:hypothetical protein
MLTERLRNHRNESAPDFVATEYPSYDGVFQVHSSAKETPGNIALDDWVDIFELASQLRGSNNALRNASQDVLQEYLIGVELDALCRELDFG